MPSIHSLSHTLLPGSTLGILGSGQLGRMLVMAARRMGYRTHVFSPEAHSPAGQIADQEVVAEYADLAAMQAFARTVDVVTFEFENIPATTAEAAATFAPVRPSGQVLHLTQNRWREKSFLAQGGLPVTPFQPVSSLAELQAALTTLGTPAILKTSAFGYDGKGQAKIASAAEAPQVWESFQDSRLKIQDSTQSNGLTHSPLFTLNSSLSTIHSPPFILESLIPFQCELSIVAARGLNGGFAHFGAVENEHQNHILDVTLAPARVSPQVAQNAIDLAAAVLDKLEVVGVLCVEMFLTPNNELLINELAPRPHNSGHFTLEACATSQFEQQLRAVCGLPLGSPEQLRPAAMANLLGDLWAAGEPHWNAALAFPDVKLHLYGKAQARPGRKMGHLTALANTPAAAKAKVLQARAALVAQP